VLAYVSKRVAKLLGDRAREKTTEGHRSRSRLVRTEARIRKLVMLIADGDDSAAVRQILSDLEAEAETLRRGVANVEREQREPVDLPSQGEICSRVFEVGELLMRDVDAGREALRALLKGGSIQLVPRDDGVYTAKCGLLPFGVLLAKASPTDARVYRRVVSGPRNQRSRALSKCARCLSFFSAWDTPHRGSGPRQSVS
jgi:hypothetical protein